MGPAAEELWDGRYRLVRRLGAGGMASVWLAHDEHLERDVALKLISDVLAGDREYIARFEREARVAAGLNHANLVTVYDFAVADERPYLVMELIPGGTIAAQELSDRDVERLAEEMLAALRHIHEAGVVHRDVKPANVLVDERGRFRLTDFGIAQPDDATALTRTGHLIGTMRYMAPEVRVGQRATERSDLYSLGVVLRESGAESVPSLHALLDALTREDPAERPRSARAAAALVGAPPTAPTLAMTGAADRRRPLLLGAVALGLVALVALVIAFTGGDDDEPAPVGGGQPPATTEQPRTQEEPARAQPEPEPAPAPPEPEPEPQPEPAPTCAELEAQKQALEEEKKAAEESAGKDKDAKEAIKDDFEERKKAIDEQLKSCKR